MSEIDLEEKESALQQRILDSPTLLPGVEGPAVAAKEVPVRRAGSADVVVVDATGAITIVECKRASNPECRRSVVGQVVEYAAGLWRLEYEDFERLLKSCTGLTNPFKDAMGRDEGSFQRAVSGNLEAGTFQLIIAVNEMTERLKKRLERAITFLDSHMQRDIRVLVAALPPGAAAPEVYGDDSAKIGPLKPKFKPDRWTLMDEISTPEAAIAAEGLLDWVESMKSRGVELTFTKAGMGVIKAPGGGNLFKLRPHEVQVSLSAVVTAGEPWSESTEQLVDNLDKIGVRLEGTRPRAPLEALRDHRTRGEFLALMEQHLESLGG
jgi:hypothetical protein